MSFALTSAQILARTKTVTRRTGWALLQPGTLLQPIAKGQGLKKGEKVQKVGHPVRVVSVRRECLQRMVRDRPYGHLECIREGFPDLSARQFVEMFTKHNGVRPDAVVTRIEFAYNVCVGCGCEIGGIGPGLCGECGCEDDCAP